MALKRTFASFLLVCSVAHRAHSEETIVWRGDHVIGSPVSLGGRTLSIASGSRIAFKGGGRLDVGGLVATDAVFEARSTLTNAFRIFQSGGILELNNCRFRGMRTVHPAKEHFLRGFLMSVARSDARVLRCTFADCSPLMLVNAKKAEICGNLVKSCSEGVYLLDCTECAVRANEFFDATDTALLVSGTRLSDFVENRFTDCATGLTVRYCGSNRFIGNAFFGNEEGVLLQDVKPENRFVGTRFEDCGRAFSKRGKTPGCVMRGTEINGRGTSL